MANNLTLALELSAHTNRLTGGLSRGQQAVRGFAQGVRREIGALTGVFGTLEGKLAGIGLGVGLGMGLSNAARAAAEAEHSLRAMGNAGGLSRGQLASVGDELLNTAKEVNKTRQELIKGMDVLVSAGMEFDRAKSLIKDIGYASTGTQAELEDLAQTAFTLDQNLKVLPKDMGYALNVLATAGYQGSFELKNMARFFPVITAQVQKLHMEGPKAAAALGAALQIAKHGAGTNEEAATNLANFLAKLTSPETTKNFEKKFGVNWEKVFKNSISKAEDPLMASVEFIRKKVGTDPFKLGELFGDMQVMNFLGPMMKELEEYQKIRDKALAGNGTVDRAFREMMDTSTEQWKRMGITMESIIQKSETLRKLWTEGNKALAAANNYLGGGGNTSAQGPVQPKDVSLEKLAGLAAGGIAGTYALTRILPAAMGGLLGGSANLAVGVGVGHALQATAGVTPVFVVNMPGGGIVPAPGVPPVGIPPVGTPPTRTPPTGAPRSPTDMMVLGAGWLGGAAAVGAAGYAGWQAGSWLYDNAIPDSMADRIGYVVTKGLSLFGSADANRALAINENQALQAKLARDYGGAGQDAATATARVLNMAGNEEARRAIELSTRIDNAGTELARKLNSVDLGGTITVRFDGQGRPIVTGMQANSPGMRINVDTGPTMVLPQ